MYEVIKGFPERFDSDHIYKVNDVYPREGFQPPNGRAEALASGKKGEMNRTGKVYLVASVEKQEPELTDMEAPPKKAKKKE